MRSIPPVLSDYPVSEVTRAFRRRYRSADAALELLRGVFGQRYPERSLELVDSGTSALSLAMKAASGDALVAVPAYCCPDVGTALQMAGVKGMAYDTDPSTLSPDLDSLRRCLLAGCRSVVVAHLFGYPVDVEAICEVLAPFGASLIEDAAQQAGGRLAGTRLGSFGCVSVMSFGRGKGLNAMGGGALLRSAERPPADSVACLPLSQEGSLRTSLAALALRIAAKPQLYGAISRIPWLRIGETRYHPPSTVGPMNVVSALLLQLAFESDEQLLRVRVENAVEWEKSLEGAVGISAITPVPTAQPGYLRYAVRTHRELSTLAARFGVVRAYPRTLLEYRELRYVVSASSESLAGARELSRSLLTLPTHAGVQETDRQRVRETLVG